MAIGVVGRLKGWSWIIYLTFQNLIEAIYLLKFLPFIIPSYKIYSPACDIDVILPPLPDDLWLLLYYSRHCNVSDGLLNPCTHTDELRTSAAQIDRCWESPTVLDNVLIKWLLCLTFTSSCPALECINTLKQSHFLVRQLWSLSKWEYSDWTCLADQNVTFFKVVLKIHFKPFWVIYGKTNLGENWGMSHYLATNVTLGGGLHFFRRLSKCKRIHFHLYFKRLTFNIGLIWSIAMPVSECQKFHQLSPLLWSAAFPGFRS